MTEWIPGWVIAQSGVFFPDGRHWRPSLDIMDDREAKHVHLLQMLWNARLGKTFFHIFPIREHRLCRTDQNQIRIHSHPNADVSKHGGKGSDEGGRCSARRRWSVEKIERPQPPQAKFPPRSTSSPSHAATRPRK